MNEKKCWLLNLFIAGTDYTSQNLTSKVDPRTERIENPRYKDEIPNVLFQTWMSVPISLPEQISEAHGGDFIHFSHIHTSLKHVKGVDVPYNFGVDEIWPT